MNDDYKIVTFNAVVLFLLYNIGILGNILIITVICLDVHLHSPMYFFLCNLAIVDICFTSVTVPNLLYILISGDDTMSPTQCLIQMFFFFLAGTGEDTIILVMAYDRYVAICHPLHYHRILNKTICILLMAVIWICVFVNSSLLVNSVLKMFFCSSTTIHQFFCDAKALVNISCGGTDIFYMLIYANCLVLGLCPSVCNLMSYVKIIKVILRIKSKDGRRKAFSTCSSHLTVMTIYYGSAISVYMMPKSEHYNLLEQILTAFYSTGIPMLNPLIYSLRNNDIRNSLRKLISAFWHDNAYFP
uniref:G-protein coupled receptors family 1 profile domain-containing protein n=1 Tax=Pyxicephalus adspersus TaxID=30357 RepID=A0AAV2ZWY2_PYXAD|nr:TPA: hypothetical protein GDO54_015071 [Pyxicephalus adspersus]